MNSLRFFLRPILSGVVFIGLLNSASAQQKLTPEAVYGLNYVNIQQASPDGKKVLYSLSKTDLASNRSKVELYSLDLATGQSTQLTNNDVNEGQPRWTPDGQRIAFLTGGNLMEMAATPGAAMTQVAENVDGFVFAAGGSRIALIREVVIGKTLQETYSDLPRNSAKRYDGLMARHWTQWRDTKRNHVFVAGYANGKLATPEVDVMPGEDFDAPVLPFGGSEQIALSPNGRLLVYASKKVNDTEDATTTNTDLYLYDIDAKTTKNVTQSNLGYDTEPKFSPDGLTLYWLQMRTPAYEADKNRLMAMTMTINTIGGMRDLTAAEDVTVESYEIAANGGSIVIRVPVNGTEQLYSLNLLAKSVNPPMTKLTEGQFNINNFVLGISGKTPVMIATRQSMRTPNEIVQLTIGKKGVEYKTLVSPNPDLAKNYLLGDVKSIQVPATDGKSIQAWVITPPNFDPNKKYPTLLYCQGGPQSQISQFWSTRWNMQLFANEGYIVVAPNRRGLPGFGQAWNDAITKDWGGQAMKDLVSAAEFATKMPGVDATRMGAIGASFGGYSVYWLAGNAPNLFKTFVAHCGVFNLTSMYGTTEEVFFMDHDMGGPYWQRDLRANYEKFSPHNYVQNWSKPMLVIHNELDFRVPIDQGLQAFTAAQKQNIKSRLLVFPDEGHWVLKPQNSVVWWREVTGFLKETL